MDQIEDPRVNYSPVVGSGLKCVPGDPANCGDGFPAKLAKLNHPKGIAITSDGSIYVADGPNLRFVDGHGIIRTLIGSHSHRGSGGSRSSGFTKTTDFESCRVKRKDIDQVQLHWPSNLALNLVENKLLFIDEGILFQITDDNQLERVFGCTSSSDKIVRPILDLAFSPKGQLYFVTEDSNLYTVKRPGEVLLVRTDKISPYGHNSSRLIMPPSSSLPSSSSSTSSPSSGGDRHHQRNNLDAGFVSAVSVGADGTVYIADQANLELMKVADFIPTPADMNTDYEVVFPATGEIYVFNRYGQHTYTKDLKSGKVLYSFLYTKNTSYGKLSKISDSAENKILFLRDYSSVVSTIENTQGKKCNLKINHLGRLVHFQEMENSEIRLEYSDEGLLLAKTTTSGLSSLYAFDRFGRVRRVIGETGVITNFDYELVGSAIQVRVSDSQSKKEFLRFSVLQSDEKDEVVVNKMNGADNVVRRRVLQRDIKNASYSLRTEDGALLSGGSWGIYPLLKDGIPPMPIEGNLMRGPSYQFLVDLEQQGSSTSGTGSGSSVSSSSAAAGTTLPHHQQNGNKHEWKFGLLGDGKGPERILDRQMWVNDSRVLSLEFDQSLSREVIQSRDRDSIFYIQYDKTGLPLYFIPGSNNGYRFSMNITYDRFKRVESWKWGEGRGLQVTYGRNGFATEMKNLDGSRVTTIDYNEYGQPSNISLRSGRSFLFHYDIHGGLKSVETPKQTRHSFILQHSISFTKLVYQPPGYGVVKNSFVKYFNTYGLLESILLPSDNGRIFQEYDLLRRPTHMLYSEGKLSRKYKAKGVTITIVEGKFDSTTHLWTNGLGKIVQEKQEFNAKSGLAASKLVYEYDSNFRPIVMKARIGGNVLPDFVLAYNGKSGGLDQLGTFRIAQSNSQETSIFDGMAIFTKRMNGYGQPVQYSLTIQAEEVFRMDFFYINTSHQIQQIRVKTKNIGTAPVRNFTYDSDGQLTQVDSSEPWKFEYDMNGNLKSLTYRENTIALEHNDQDRIVRFGDSVYNYDMVGRIVQNAREEFFTYNALGQLKRAWKRGRFDVEYFYDHEGRLVARKDNHGNATQFIYADVQRKELVTHIYSPRENRLVHLVYDESERLIFFQVNRNQKYYVASDHCGTPMLIFNQYGQVMREISRSPFGHIVYDSDSYFYLPIDYCGGIHDKVTYIFCLENYKRYFYKK